MNGAADQNAKKRSRLDLLASLDAAFASSSSATAQESKYTSKAAAAESNAAAQQQAYLQTKKRKRRNKQPSQQPQQPAQNGSNAATGKPQQPIKTEPSKKSYDPLYGKLDVESVLSIGMKGCSLHPKVKSFAKPQAFSTTLKSFLETATQANHESAAIEKLKNKLLQLDNPIKTTDAARQAARQAQAAQVQTAQLISARRRRQLGLHMLSKQNNGIMSYDDAQRLSTIWKRYAMDLFGRDFDDDLPSDTRTARIQAKLKTLDFSGCPILVIQARNPTQVGLSGVIVSEKTHVVEVCTPNNQLITLVKNQTRFRVLLSETKQLAIGTWLATRNLDTHQIIK